jgi:hypothetical protein
MTTYLIRNHQGVTAIVAADSYTRDSDGYLILSGPGEGDPVAVFAPGGWDCIIAEPPADVTARSPWSEPRQAAVAGAGSP